MKNYSEYINWNRALKCLNIDLKGMSKLHRDLCELTIDYMLDNERLEHYRRQLNIYAYLVEQRTGNKVSNMHLYYTGEENSNPKITFPYTTTAVDGTIAAFDDTVKHIMKKDFNHCSSDSKTCKNCDFRFYCER